MAETTSPGGVEARMPPISPPVHVGEVRDYALDAAPLGGARPIRPPFP